MPAPKKAPSPKRNGNKTTNGAAERVLQSFTPATTSPATTNVEELVRRRAYEIYETSGRPEGRAEEHWLQAEAELRGRTA